MDTTPLKKRHPITFWVTTEEKSLIDRTMEHGEISRFAKRGLLNEASRREPTVTVPETQTVQKAS